MSRAVTEPIIKTDQLGKIYGQGAGKFVALSDINLAIAPGEAVAILGKSGSGKSTLMHLLALMDEPSRGSVSIDAQKVKSLPTKKLDLLRNKTFGFVFQQFFLNGNATVLENVILPLKIAGVNSRERKKRALSALKTVDLADKAGNRANDLSGGQKQRVVIARALVNEPQIIFADEPTGNLDSATGKLVEDKLFELNRTKHITLIIVTHDEELAKRCDRQIHIKDGKIVRSKA